MSSISPISGNNPYSAETPVREDLDPTKDFNNKLKNSLDKTQSALDKVNLVIKDATNNVLDLIK